MSNEISRRRWMIGSAATAGLGAGAVHLAGQHGLLPPDSGGLYGCGHSLTYAAHRLLLRGGANAREFEPNQISKTPHPKGPPPKGEEFARLSDGGFKDWRLQVNGNMATRPRAFSIEELKNLPAQSQITQLICEEGWSYIAEWTGVPLSRILEEAGARPEAKYAVCHSMDGWIDAIDMEDARHRQTLVSFGMNGRDLPVGHGGPLRLRVPRQLGYKSLKFLHRIAITDTLEGVPVGGEYSWYAGI